VSEHKLESAAYLAETLCHEDCQCGNTPEQGGHCDSCTAKHIEADRLAVVRAVLRHVRQPSNADAEDAARVLRTITQPRRDGGAV
jgi:hypothetical protein